jgi:hypothetical protein
MGLNCRDCADHQQEIPAVTMVGKTPVCREHWRSRMGIPKKVGEQPAAIALPEGREEEEVKQMGRGPGTSQETIDAIRKDAAAGLSLNQIAEKHSVSWPTAKKFSSGGKKPAGGATLLLLAANWQCATHPAATGISL